MANPSDTSFAVIKETTAGTTPATPVFNMIDHVPGRSPQYTSDFVQSQVLKPNRSASAGRKSNFRVEDGLDVQFKRDAAVDVFLESVLSNTFATNELKGGKSDVSMTIERKMLDGATTLYSRYTGCQVASLSLSCEAAGNADMSVDVLGMGSTNGTAIITGATYTPSAATMNLNGADVSTVTIAGLTADYSSLELSIERDLEPKSVFGSTSAVGIGTAGPRNISLALTFYREDFSPETVLGDDTPLAVTFTIGSGANGYQFTLPACTCTLPADEEDGAKQLVTATFTASYDATEDTDIIVTKLA